MELGCAFANSLGLAMSFFHGIWCWVWDVPHQAWRQRYRHPYHLVLLAVRGMESRMPQHHRSRLQDCRWHHPVPDSGHRRLAEQKITMVFSRITAIILAGLSVKYVFDGLAAVGMIIP